MRVATAEYTTQSSGSQFLLPTFVVRSFVLRDSDGDDLSDIAEFILGTDPNNPDTDGDGVRDGAEIQQGLDPLSGRPAANGVIASLPLPGEAKEVVLEGSILDSAQQTAYLALGSRGLGIVNASQFQKPILLGQLDLPGDATAVAVDSNLRIAAVAANASGLHLVNVADPMQPALLQTINLNARQVEVIGGVAYVAGGDLWSFDLASRALLQQLPLGGATLTGLAGEGLFLYTMDSSRVLRAIDLRDGAMTPRGALALSSASGRLFVGNGIAYVAAGDGQNGGFSTVDVSDPDNLRLISGVDALNVQGQAVVANGSGLAVAVGNVRGPQGQANAALDVLNVSDPANTADFRTRFPLTAAPFSVAIGAGIAFVADGTAGLQVVNYRSFDNLGVPPTITLSNSFTMTSPTNGVVEEGKLVLLSARTTDDVQVRTVEFFVDGVRVFNDASLPFEHRFIAPRRTAAKTNLIVRAKATDTGGNFTWSDAIEVALVPDASPPRVLGMQPGASTVVSQAVNAVFIYFNEPLDVGTIVPANVFLIDAGPDGQAGTPDDATLTASLSWRETLNAVVLALATPLPPGVYQATVMPAIADVAGNHMTNRYTGSFASIVGGPDGDYDEDGITNGEELRLGTNPLKLDSDGDGWSDSDEIVDRADPLNPLSRPQINVLAGPPILMEVPGASSGIGGKGLHLARPPVDMLIPSPETDGSAGRPAHIARPPVLIDLSGSNPSAIGGGGLYLARPPVKLKINPQ